MEFLPALSPLGRLCDPKKEGENPDLIPLLDQSLANDLAIIYAVAIWLVILHIRSRKKLSPIGSKSNYARN